MPKWVDRTGLKYGKLTCVKYLGHKKWLCKCDCGNECLRESRNLHDRSDCGCGKPMRDRAAGEKRSKHGESRTRLYKRWTSMLQRCENPNNRSFANYGGRGISVCDEWHDYPTFRGWALANGYEESLSIDRIDTNGNYEPSNCRWTTSSVQLSNRRHYRRKDMWKEVEAIDENGKVIARFENISMAYEWLGRKNCATGISKALCGEQRTAYGYGWRYVNGEA